MSKILKAARLFKTLFSNPKSILTVLEHEETFRKEVRKNYPSFSNGLPVLNLLDLFPGLNETVSPYSFLDGTSLPSDLALLKQLARRFTGCSYLEIGTWRGESVANVAAVAKECYTINLPDAEMRNRGLPEKYIQLHRYFSRDLINVTHLQHHSSTFDFSSLRKKFDLIFVDGDHHFSQVKEDTQSVFQLLRDEKSVIVWHDYARNPEQVRYEVLAGILSGCPAEHRNKLFHVSNTLCAIFTREQHPTHAFIPFSEPDQVFELKMTGKKIASNQQGF
jgi:predicted O-methyltransferase YrrM